ncbi:hypothetical protein ANN_18897 [Periplaneta americana]|uniref:Uncharacterized protein n=1 Tax=Periplaneta americana TaxID=6978 RepID=A0ABQ8SR93_PERAM|nr:hypothetical protein ANN_18897 [Periplaneta americana]
MAGLCEGSNEPPGFLNANFSKCKCPKDKEIPSNEREFIVDQRTMRKMVIGGIEKVERNMKEQRRLEVSVNRISDKYCI